MKIKLTKAQARILGELPEKISDLGSSWKPATKLVELGLATKQDPRSWGNPEFLRTPAGDEWLKDNPKK